MIRWLRRGLALLGSLVLLAVAGVAGMVWLTLPGGDVSAGLPGLSAPATVTLDADGIARITAQSDIDAAEALGFVHARERLFQMDLMRRAASGELSELFGAATLPFDRMARTLGLRNRAAAGLPGMNAEARALLEAYARGVNAWIARRGRLSAPEFAVFGTPRAWTPVDSLLWGKTMALFLSGNWREEQARLALSAKLPPEVIDALWPGGTAGGHPEARAADPAVTATARQLAAVMPDWPAPFTLPHSASNAWAVDGAHSATGAPLLAGDPHLAFGFPGIWYLARIDTPHGVLAGATAPGVPFMVLGHNSRIAWSFTTTGADVQDLFIETPAGAGQYQTPDGPAAFVLRQEHIRVRGAPDEILTVRETRHGPVISDLVDPKGPVLALAAANLAAGDTAAEGLMALNRAGSVAEAGLAAARISSPVQNLMLADHDGIGLFVTGRVPLRRAGDGSRPVDGADGAHDWTGWASGAQLPHVVAPASGRLVNANERVAPADFPVFMGRDWFAPDRAGRIRALLAATPQHTVARFAAIQTDVLDPAAAGLLPALLAAKVPEGPAHAAQVLLAGWDGTAAMDAPQPLIFNAWVQAFRAALLTKLGVTGEELSAAAPWPQLLRHALSPQGALLCGGDCAPLLVDSLQTAVTALAAEYGPDPAAWRWGAAHQAVFAHPALRLIPLLGPMLEGRIATAGDGNTVARGGTGLHGFQSIHGPEFRAVYDLADLERSRFALAPGQSGNPFTALARNLLARWRGGVSLSLAAHPAETAVHLTLTPSEAAP